ncbi:hypothetical protein QZH41_011317, partial [Actinostola sp. cb2023]
IEIKERSMEDMLYELRVMKDKNERLKQRNKRLKEEQLTHIKNLLKSAKEKDREVESIVKVNHEQVEEALLNKFDVKRSEAQSVEEKELEIKKVEEQIEDVRTEIKKRKEYRDNGKLEHAKQILLMKHDLEDMEISHSDIAAHLERSLNIAKEEISSYTDNTLSKQKDIASEKATNSLDKYSRAEILDNRWLKKEVAIHNSGHRDLITTVEELEKRNLDIMSELFDCKIEDLKFTRKFYLACIENAESSDEELEDNEITLAVDGVVSEQTEKPDDLLDNFFLPGEDNLEDSPRLGPMELQLLSLVGTSKPIYKCEEGEDNSLVPANSSVQVRPDNYGDPKNWPITNQMLSSIVSQ